jgi:Zn-dependent protease
MFSQDWIYQTLLLLVPMMLSFSIHEYAHARTALAFGDPTAKLQGRVTLNPLAHLDPMGTIVLVLTHFVGWAKPVPVNRGNLHPPALGEICVSLAGPFSNIFLAVICGLLLKGWMHIGIPDNAVGNMGVIVIFATMMMNIGLAAFNLIPLFPLDGHHVLRELLPQRMQYNFMLWQMRYGMYVLLAVTIVPNVLRNSLGMHILGPVDWMYIGMRWVINAIVGLPPEVMNY